jgi:hypothetical protein
VPSDLKVQLSFNSTAGSVVTYSTCGHTAGDDYFVTAQVSTALTTTGRYSYTLTVQVHYTGQPSVTLSTPGSYDVVVTPGSSPVGTGWSITILDRLVAVTGGVLWVYGDGPSAFFLCKPSSPDPARERWSCILTLIGVVAAALEQQILQLRLRQHIEIPAGGDRAIRRVGGRERLIAGGREGHREQVLAVVGGREGVVRREGGRAVRAREVDGPGVAGDDAARRP